MHKSAQLRDLKHQWPERRKSCTQDIIKSVASAPVSLTSNQLIACRSIASSSRAVSVSRISTSASLKKHGNGSRQRRLPLIHVKLAEENFRNCQSDSDSSCYDSFNEMETDSAKDESDCSDGYVTDGFATMDIFEYEVDDSSDSEDLYSHGSSSGTDDMVEVVAKALFASSSDSDDFEILAQDADTEESDAPTDPELGRADYWKCIKCKNDKNNPMYRFCEKCYQIRKNHFPPRPKHRRKRSSMASRCNSKLFSLCSPSTSSPISTHDDKPDEDGRMSRNSSDGSDETGNQFIQKSMQARKQQQQQRRRTTSQKQTHSAGESSCCSSQELSPDEQQSTATYLMAACASSQETYCSDIEQIVNLNPKQSNLGLFEHNYPNSQENIYTNSESASQASIYQNGCSIIKHDSSASTVSGCSGFSQSSTQYETNGNQSSTEIVVKSCSSSSIDEAIKPTSTTSINCSSNISTGTTRKFKKRKMDFSDEISDSDVDDEELMAKKFRAMDDADSSNGMCMICLSEPKNGAFVHNRFLHVCCCYRCTVKVWNKRKRCPICNSQVKTVLKMFVH